MTRLIECYFCGRYRYNAVCACRRFILRLPTLTEWRELATDDEVAAGNRRYALGLRNGLTAALHTEHGKRQAEQAGR